MSLCPRCAGPRDRPSAEGNCDPQGYFSQIGTGPFPAVHPFHNEPNVRSYVTREARYEAGWNPTYCFYGWPHLLHPAFPDKCWRCDAGISVDLSTPA